MPTLRSNIASKKSPKSVGFSSQRYSRNSSHYKRSNRPTFRAGTTKTNR